MSHGLFYFYFKNKDELLVELVRRINKDMRHYLTTSTADLPNRVEVEKKGGFEAFLEWMRRNKYLYRILIEAESNNIELYKWHYMKLAERYSERLSEAMDRNEIAKHDPEVLSFALMGGIADFIAKRYVLWSDGEVPGSVIKEVSNLLDKLLSPPHR